MKKKLTDPAGEPLPPFFDHQGKRRDQVEYSFTACMILFGCLIAYALVALFL